MTAQQDWREMDGATAWHLIDRQADGWDDVRDMMEQWLVANGGTLVCKADETDSRPD